MSEIAERGYGHPEALVSTEWVAAHLDDPGVRVVESEIWLAGFAAAAMVEPSVSSKRPSEALTGVLPLPNRPMASDRTSSSSWATTSAGSKSAPTIGA